MKLTWFGGTTIRIHIGGAILVLDPAGAPAAIAAAELVSGADMTIADFGADLPAIDAARWKPRPPARLLDEAASPPVEAWSVGRGAVLIDAVGEPPLLLVSGIIPELGRWVDAGVFVLFGHGAQLTALGIAVLDGSPPRLLALAADEASIDMALAAVRNRLDGTGLVALEAGLALEV